MKSMGQSAEFFFSQRMLLHHLLRFIKENMRFPPAGIAYFAIDLVVI
jgi:hypothetical protein